MSLRCASCGASHEGWAEVHHIVSDTGLDFCSQVCVERFEDDNDCKVVVVAESGTQAVADFADGWALWQEHRPQSAEDWVEVAKRCAADPDFDHTKSSPLFGAAVLLAREIRDA